MMLAQLGAPTWATSTEGHNCTSPGGKYESLCTGDVDDAADDAEDDDADSADSADDGYADADDEK